MVLRQAKLAAGFEHGHDAHGRVTPPEEEQLVASYQRDGRHKLFVSLRHPWTPRWPLRWRFPDQKSPAVLPLGGPELILGGRSRARPRTVLDSLANLQVDVQDEPPEGRARGPRVELSPFTEGVDKPAAFEEAHVFQDEIGPLFPCSVPCREATKVQTKSLATLPQRNVVASREGRRGRVAKVGVKHVAEPWGDDQTKGRRLHKLWPLTCFDKRRDVPTDLQQQIGVDGRGDEKQRLCVRAELTAQVVNLLRDIQPPRDVMYDVPPPRPQLDASPEEVLTCLQRPDKVPRNVFGLSFKRVEFFAGLGEDSIEAFERLPEPLDLLAKPGASGVWSAVPSSAARPRYRRKISLQSTHPQPGVPDRRWSKSSGRSRGP